MHSNQYDSSSTSVASINVTTTTRRIKNQTPSSNYTPCSSVTSANESPAKDTKLADTFHRLMYTIEKGNAIMQGCADAVSNLNGKVAPSSEKKQYLGERKDKVIVEIKCAFLKIINIETLEQTFEAEVFILAKWQEPALKDVEDKKETEYDSAKYWIPKLKVLNTVKDLEWSRRNFTVKFMEKNYKYPVVTLAWRFKGKFLENLELEHFPFDVQDLTLQISTERSDSEVELIEDQHALSTVNTKTFQDAQAWNIYTHVETFRDETTQEYVSSTIHPILFAQCRVKRKIAYYMWNIVFIVALITISTFCMVTEEPETVDRMYNNVTLLLTASIFKTVIHQSLPTISYLTYLDVYVLVTLVFLALQIAENSIMALLSKTVTKREVLLWDVYAISALAIVFILFHVLFLVYIYLTACRRRRLMEQKDKLYAAKREHLKKYGVMLKPNFDTPKSKKIYEKMNKAEYY